MSEVITTEQANTRLTINPITRIVAPKYRNTEAVYVAKGDHNSVCLAFEIPRYVDGYDMSAEENIIHIHFANMDGEDKTKVSKGFSEAKSITVEKDDTSQEEVVSFLWVLTKEATRYAGLVSFGITFERYDTVDGEAQEVYSWSTKPYGKTIVWDSMDNSSATVEREYDYLVDTVNAIVSASMDSKVTEAGRIIDEKISNAGKEIDRKLTEAEKQAHLSKSYAIGETGIRDGEGADNAKHYASLSEEHEKNAKVTAEALKDTLTKAGNAIALASSLEKGEAENSFQQVGSNTVTGISLSDKEINFVSFDSATNVLTLNTDDTFFDYNSIFAFRITNLNLRTYVDIVRVLESRKVGDNWEFTIFSPIEELNLGTPNRLTISAIINDESVVSKNNIALFEGSYSAGKESLSAGYKALALAPFSLAIGWGACAGALGGIAIGHNARVLDNYGIAIATDSLAGYCAFAGMAFTKALGMYSASFSWYGNSSGDKSFTANDHTEARAENSSAFGLYTVANVKDQFVNGRFNIIDENEEFAEITGNGTGINSRSNARTLDWKGNEWLAGRVRVGTNKELLPTENEVRGLILESKNDYANSIKSDGVSGNLVKIDDISPTARKIKVNTQASKVIATSKNLLDLNRQFTRSNCTVLSSNSVQVNIQNGYYATLYPYYLHNLLQELDGQTITLSIAEGTTGYLTLYVSYVEGGGKEARSNSGETSVSLTLDHQGKTVKQLEIRLHRRGVAFTDTETVIEDIQLEIDDRTDFAKPHSEIYKIFDVVSGECEVDSLGTAMTILPDSTSAEIEVVYNVDTKKYVDNAIDKIGNPEASSPITVDSAMSDTSTNPVQNKVVKKYVDKAIEKIKIPEPTTLALAMTTSSDYVLSASNWSSTTDEGEEYHFIDIFDITLPSSNNITIEMDTANNASIIERKASIEASLFVTTSPDNAIRVIALTKPVIDIPVNIAVIYEEG